MSVARELGRAGVRKVLQRTGIIEESVTSLPADPCEVVQLLDASWYEERLQKLAAELGRDPESVRAEKCLQVGKQWELQRRDEDLQRKYELFLSSRDEEGMAKATADVAAGGRVEWQGDYTRGRHRDGEAGAADHQTRRHLRSFQQGSE